MIIRDPKELSQQGQILWHKQEGIIKIYSLPFALFETMRSIDRQKVLFESGYSKTMNSNHLTGDAWDVAQFGEGGFHWRDIFFFQVLGILTVNLIKGIRWGADWNGKNLWWDEQFRDYGHYEVSK